MNDQATIELPVADPAVVPVAEDAAFPGRFIDLGRLQVQETVNERTKKFIGDGGQFLMVVGLKKLEAVRIGSVNVPLSEKRLYPKTSAMNLMEEVEEPVITLRQAPDGRSVLLRSVISNHGRWQRGQPIYVTGFWDEAEYAAAADELNQAADVINAEGEDAARKRRAKGPAIV